MFLIEKVQESERGELARILTDAFVTNPAYSLIFKKKDQLEEGLLWLFKANLLIHNWEQTLTRVVREKDTGKIAGTFTLLPPDGIKIPLSVYFKVGILGFVRKFGLQSLIRMFALGKCNDSTLRKAIQTPEYHYLSMVVIREEYRGTGVGTFSIRSAIQELVASNPACKVLGLTTQLPENVAFYSRLGFTKLNEGDINFKGDRYSNYNMRYDIE